MPDRTCSIDDCDTGGKLTRGWCMKHYTRWRTHGDPSIIGKPRPRRSGGSRRKVPPETRFWPKVNKDGPVPPKRPDLGPCWIWTAGRNELGYGKFSLNGKKVYAHRFAYELLVGPIPAGRPHLDHLCRNPPCCNPAHLEPVTPRVNLLRGVGASALNAAKTHCPKLHLYDEANTYIGADGSRECRACARELQAAMRARRRAAAA